MREIKFRAWFDNQMFYEGWNKDFFVTKEIILRHEKDIMQFTGLKDKNGKEIYEGDIIKYKKRWGDEEGKVEIGFIDYESPSYWIYFDKEKSCCTGIINILHAFKETKCEVIGNIYENPELIE